MAQTLFERLVYGKTKAEQTVYNPLESRVGNRFRIDTIDYRREQPYVLRGLIEYTRTTNSKNHKFTDYLFEDFRLRITPNEIKSQSSFSCYLLKEDGREPWMPELYDNLCSPSGEFNIHRENLVDKYFRFLSEGEREAGSPHRATVRQLVDENLDGKIQDNEISTTYLEYFDFYRQREDEANQKYFEFLFVEFCEDKTFLFLVGKEAIPENVICL